MQLMNSGFGVGSNGGNAPWITDIHNGIVNPNFTYTGGQAIVPDENGILRRTPVGQAAVEGGRWAATVAEGAVLGAELITAEADRTFSSDTGFWIQMLGWAIGGGVAVASSAFTTMSIYCPSLGTIGKHYQVIVDVVGITSGGVTAAMGGALSPDVATTPGRYTFIINGTTSTSGNIGIRCVDVTNCTIDNISIREVIPQWLPPTSGTTRSIATRKGLRTIQTSDAFLGMLGEPAMTNKCTCRKSNPTATTNITQTGDGAAVLSMVTDPSTYLSGAGLANICSTNKIYKWDNSLGVGAAIAVLGGTTVNTNVHSFSMYIIAAVGSGTVYLRTDAADAVAIPATFQRLKKENVTPDTTARQVRIAIDAGAIVYFILPQLEENPFCTSIIAPAVDTAAAQTRQASVVSAPTAGVFPSTGQDFAIFMRVVPAGDITTVVYPKLISMYVDANNLFQIYLSTDTMYFQKKLATVSYQLTTPFDVSVGAALEVICIQTSMGMSFKKRLLSGAWSAWINDVTAGAKLPASLSSSYQIGSANSVSQFTANYPRTAIIAMPPKATLAEYQTWIEEELTRRGLI